MVSWSGLTVWILLIILYPFIRKTDKKEETLLFICNFAPVLHEKYIMGSAV